MKSEKIFWYVVETVRNINQIPITLKNFTIELSDLFHFLGELFNKSLHIRTTKMNKKRPNGLISKSNMQQSQHGQAINKRRFFVCRRIRLTHYRR